MGIKSNERIDSNKEKRFARNLKAYVERSKRSGRIKYSVFAFVGNKGDFKSTFHSRPFTTETEMIEFFKQKRVESKLKLSNREFVTMVIKRKVKRKPK